MPWTAPRRMYGTPPAGAIVHATIQAPVAGKDSRHVRKMRCSTCFIEYDTLHNERASCPLCDVSRELATKDKALQAEQHKSAMMAERLLRMEAANDVAASMRLAVNLIGEEDLIFLKQMLYRWRAEEPMKISVIHHDRKIRRKKFVAACGWMILPGGGGTPEIHECSSLGGLGIADDFETAAKTWSTEKAMDLLINTLATHLSGRTR